MGTDFISYYWNEFYCGHFKISKLKLAVTKIKLTDLKAKGLSQSGFFLTLSNVSAGQNIPVKYSFRYRN